MAISPEVSDLFTECQESLESERSGYLLRCVIDDLKYLQGEVHKLTQTQEEYLSTDWVALLFDADKKARATRAKSRIERIAKILCSSIRIEPTPLADQTEEMMRIAMEMADQDVFVLKRLRGAVDKYQHLAADALHILAVPDVPGVKPDSRPRNLRQTSKPRVDLHRTTTCHCIETQFLPIGGRLYSARPRRGFSRFYRRQRYRP